MSALNLGFKQFCAEILSEVFCAQISLGQFLGGVGDQIRLREEERGCFGVGGFPVELSLLQLGLFVSEKFVPSSFGTQLDRRFLFPEKLHTIILRFGELHIQVDVHILLLLLH